MLLILLGLTLCTQAQEFEPMQFRVKRTDTTGTYIKIINYFDRSFYPKFYFDKEINGQHYTGNVKPDSTGLAKVVYRAGDTVHIYVNEVAKLSDVHIEKEKLNLIEIMDSKALIHLKFKNHPKNQEHVFATVCKESNDVQRLKVPSVIKVDPAVYNLKTEQKVESPYSFYTKPSHIYTYYVNELFQLQIANALEFQEIRISFYDRKKKAYQLIHSFEREKVDLFLPSNTTYRIDYRRPKRRKFVSKYCKAHYINPLVRYVFE